MELITTRATIIGPPNMFEGAAYLDMFFEGNEKSNLRASITHFVPGARTVWHRHARGQILHVAEGRGRAQSRGAEPFEIGPGDTVYTPSGEWHWHGATDDHLMTHLAIGEGHAADDEPETEWGDRVESKT